VLHVGYKIIQLYQFTKNSFNIANISQHIAELSSQCSAVVIQITKRRHIHA